MHGSVISTCIRMDNSGAGSLRPEDSAGNNYIGEVYTTADPGTSNAITKATAQAVDTHGNVITEPAP